LLIDAEASGRVPALIAGDFNLEFSQLHCLGNLVASGWMDIGSEPTCAVAATTVPRRIDMLLANAAFHDWSRGTRLSGLPASLPMLPNLSLSSTGRRRRTKHGFRRPRFRNLCSTSPKTLLGQKSPLS
jgi:hypothetical protein